MAGIRIVSLLFAGLLWNAAPASAQAPTRPISTDSARSAVLTPPLLFAVYAPSTSARDPSSLTAMLRLEAAPDHRGRNAVVGGLIGAATGVITCTVISNLVKDTGSGFTTCDTKAYVGFALGGAAAGALIGALIR